MKFLEELSKRTLVMDGAMGTQLMERGVRPEDCFDVMNLKRPDLVEEIHRAYVEAGADIIETNTFGANRIKLTDYGLEGKVVEINVAAAELARKAMGSKGFVCGSMGPLGKMIEPLGEITFDQAYEAFAEQAKALEKGGVDVVSIETISDLQEMRAAVIAVKSETKLPVIASLTYDADGKTVYGTPPEVAAVVLEALGVEVLAANCSTGPEDMLVVIKRLLKASARPLMAMPNAGMPELIGNRAVYHMTPEKFGRYAAKFANLGVKIIGGCCGTGPEHIAQVKTRVKQQSVSRRKVLVNARFASRTKVVETKAGKLLLIGERINPSGRRLFQEEIKLGKSQILRQEAEFQTKAGADLLDINVSVAETSESANMQKAVDVVQSVTDLPLSIDSPNRFALEAGLKHFCGRALLNSVNGKKESLELVLPLAKKYGAAIIALALDEKGLPQTAKDRLRVAEKIVSFALEKGMAKEDIFVDCLVLTAGVGISGCLETLKALPLVKERLGVKTILGISNVSHGLPNRAKLNSLYLRLALSYGLDAAIVDVTDPEIRKVLKERKVISREKLLESFKTEVEKGRAAKGKVKKEKETKAEAYKFSGYQDIKKMVIEGNREAVEILVKQALERKFLPQKIIDLALIPAMEVVGKKFSARQIFLPQVIEAAEAMSKGFELCKEKIPREKTKTLGKVVLATVKGDIHDIGKNIVKMMLENHGFQVIDLGKDVSAEIIVETVKKEKPDVVALSALLTTTMVEMAVVKEELSKAGIKVPLLVGGAVVTKSYAKKIGAAYGVDAVGAVELAKKIIKSAK